MFEQIQSKLPGKPQFLLCLLPERKNSDVYGWTFNLLTFSPLHLFYFCNIFWLMIFISLSRPMEAEKSFWVWDCDSMHCPYKSKWSIPNKCSFKDQCKGTRSLSGNVIFFPPFLWSYLLNSVLSAWWIKFNVNCWKITFYSCGFQSFNHHPWDGCITWLSWHVNTVHSSCILLIVFVFFT